MMAAGLALIALAAVIAYAGIGLWNFWIALVLLGVGWNSASSAPPISSRNATGRRSATKCRLFSDFLIFGFMAIASLSSGALLSRFRLDCRHRAWFSR